MLVLAALLTTALAAARLAERQGKSSLPLLLVLTCVEYQCDANTTYTTSNGLEFDVYPCAQNPSGTNAFYDFDTANMTECMEKCTIQGDGSEPCVAAVFNVKNPHCWVLNSTLNSADSLINNTDVITAIVSDFSSFENLDLSCSNGSTQTTANGLEFEVYCEKDLSDNNLDFQPINGSTLLHADSLHDCMELCSTMRPKCYGVTYDPGMISGYHNCFPKGPGATVNDLSYYAPGISALAKFESDFTCTGGKYNASDGIVFNMTCNEYADGQDITTVYESTFDDCISACANYTPPQGQTGGECNAVLYQHDGTDGYENCYLMTTAQANGTRSGWQLGVRLDSTGQTVPGVSPGGQGSSKSGGGGSSKAWIAGPVVGAIVAIAILLGACFWWRKGRSSKGLGRPQEMDGTKPWWRKRSELDANFTERKELEARQPALATELPGSEDWHDGERRDASNQASERNS